MSAVQAAPDLTPRFSPLVLIVDDDDGVRGAHTNLVRSLGYRAEPASDGIEALSKLPLDVDLVLLDADMPGLDGFEVARQIRAHEEHGHVPIVMISGLVRAQDRRRAFEVGVNDFLQKPVDPIELKLRAPWLLSLKSQFDGLRRQRADLEREVDRRTNALRSALTKVTAAERGTNQAHLETIRRLAIAAECKDPETARHVERIGLFAEIVARAAGLPPRQVELIRAAAPMHDVGKIGVPDHILLKPGALTDAEWKVMRSHAAKGAEILAGSTSPVIQLAERIAITHHERWDGRGYPHGLSAEAIPLEGRICAVVDFFDALTMDRPYRCALPNDEVAWLIEKGAGTHFDALVVEIFLGERKRLEQVQANGRP